METTKTQKTNDWIKAWTKPKFLGDVFAQHFVGPYEAVLDDGTKMPPLHQKNADGKWVWTDQAACKGGKVVDANGKLVCSAENYVAAMTIAGQLNRVLDSHSCIFGVMTNYRKCRDTPFSFYAIKVDHVYKNPEGLVNATESYLMPFSEGVWGLPSFSIFPIDALRFHSRAGALTVLQEIKDKIVPSPVFQKSLEKYPDSVYSHFVKNASVVKVHWLARDEMPSEGCKFIPNKDGTITKYSVNKCGVIDKKLSVITPEEK